MSCTPPCCCACCRNKNRKHYSILACYCMMECLRAGPDNGKTTLNCEYRIIHKKKKKVGKNYKTRYNMSYRRISRYLPWCEGTAPSVRLPHKSFKQGKKNVKLFFSAPAGGGYYSMVYAIQIPAACKVEFQPFKPADVFQLFIKSPATSEPPAQLSSYFL